MSVKTMLLAVCDNVMYGISHTTASFSNTSVSDKTYNVEKGIMSGWKLTNTLDSILEFITVYKLCKL